MAAAAATTIAACGGAEHAKPPPTPAGPRLSPQLARALDARLRSDVAGTYIPGASAAIVFPDGRVWINPTGTPAMATGGTGDVLTGMIAGFLGQFPEEADTAIATAVYLHGLAGMIGSGELGEKSLIATDLLAYLPDAIDECADVSNSF